MLLLKFNAYDPCDYDCSNWQFLMFGTFQGRVYLLDHQGNSVDSNLSNGERRMHSVAVNHIDVDPKGEYVATCSDDGRVSHQQNETMKFIVCGTNRCVNCRSILRVSSALTIITISAMASALKQSHWIPKSSRVCDASLWVSFQLKRSD